MYLVSQSQNVAQRAFPMSGHVCDYPGPYTKPFNIRSPAAL